MSETKSSQKALYISGSILIRLDLLDSTILRRVYKTERDPRAQKPKEISKKKELRKVGNQIL